MENNFQDQSDEAKKERYIANYLNKKRKAKEFYKLSKKEKGNSLRLFSSGGVHAESSNQYYEDNKGFE